MVTADAVVFTHSGEKTKVLLIKRGSEPFKGQWAVPGGFVNMDEEIEDAVVRELEEETGQRPGRLEKLGWIWTTPGFSDEKIHLFTAFDLEPVPRRTQIDEYIEVVRMDLREALELIWRGELNDAKSAIALLHAARRLERPR